MSTTITCVYRVPQGGIALTNLQTQVAAVPIPLDIVNAIGARVSSDSTAISGIFVVRTIVFAIVPTSPASATASIDSDGHVDAFTVSAAGGGYVVPPVVSVSGGQPLTDNPDYAAKGQALLKVVGTSIMSDGSSYTSSATATVVGGLEPNNPDAVAATLSLTVVGGHITGVAITGAGVGYTSVPTVVITDTAGSGGEITLSMGVGGIVLSYEGQQYASAPTVALVPFYKELFPDGSPNQGAPFADFMTVAIAQAVMTPVEADAPVVA